MIVIPCAVEVKVRFIIQAVAGKFLRQILRALRPTQRPIRGIFDEAYTGTCRVSQRIAASKMVPMHVTRRACLNGYCQVSAAEDVLGNGSADFFIERANVDSCCAANELLHPPTI